VGRLLGLIVLVAAAAVVGSSATAHARATAVAKAGSVTLFPGMDGPTAIISGPDGRLWFVGDDTDSIGTITSPPGMRLAA
jgi:streptogramin lyase